VSQEQKEQYFSPDEKRGPVETAYETWECRPRSAGQIAWEEWNNIQDICYAAFDDPRLPWKGEI